MGQLLHGHVRVAAGSQLARSRLLWATSAPRGAHADGRGRLLSGRKRSAAGASRSNARRANGLDDVTEGGRGGEESRWACAIDRLRRPEAEQAGLPVWRWRAGPRRLCGNAKGLEKEVPEPANLPRKWKKKVCVWERDLCLV